MELKIMVIDKINKLLLNKDLVLENVNEISDEIIVSIIKKGDISLYEDSYYDNSIKNEIKNLILKKDNKFSFYLFRSVLNKLELLNQIEKIEVANLQLEIIADFILSDRGQ